MTQKFGYVRNPLTVIAIFAAIAEISGTTVLPFISENNQATYVWFLMLFPALLVCIFFATLNFNHKVLYAPSDYKDESNFLKLFGRSTPEEREEKLKEEVADAAEAQPQQNEPPPAEAAIENDEEKNSAVIASRLPSKVIDPTDRSLIAKITLAERLAVNDLSKRLGVSMRNDVRFMVNEKRHYLFDAMANEGDAIHVLEVKLIRYMHSVLGKFDKTLLEAEQISNRAPSDKKFILHLYAVLDDEKVSDSGRFTVTAVKEEMERVVSRYTVRTDIVVVKLGELEQRLAKAV